MPTPCGTPAPRKRKIGVWFRVERPPQAVIVVSCARIHTSHDALACLVRSDKMLKYYYPCRRPTRLHFMRAPRTGFCVHLIKKGFDLVDERLRSERWEAQQPAARWKRRQESSTARFAASGRQLIAGSLGNALSSTGTYRETTRHNTAKGAKFMLLTPNPAGRARSLHSSALDSLIEEVGMVAKSEGSLSTSLSSPSPYLI